MTRVKKSKSLSIVMAGLDPAIQTAIEMFKFFLDGRVKHGHDEGEAFAALRFVKRPMPKKSGIVKGASLWDDPVSPQRHFAPQCARDDELMPAPMPHRGLLSLQYDGAGLLRGPPG
jgi:hypothetical protein